jgi:ribosomal protein S18 acetylase RimI-like enzyme
MNETVRRARIEDLDGLSDLFDQYRQFYGQPSDLTLARTFLEQRMHRSECVVFVAPAESPILAFAQLYPTFCSVSAAPLLILYDLFVAPAARGRGLARALLQAAHTFGEGSGAARLELATARTNLPAQRLYESTGWRRDEMFHHYVLPLMKT